MAKIPTLICLLCLLFCSIVFSAHAARINLVLTEASATTPLKGADGDGRGGGVSDEKVCEGITEEDCMIRRTLAAHVDYIYTQSQKHKP
ncbi:hypothetical protein MLD38_028534 [Melastoma candidum]|uniref:Uncharacterized protein n=1 Tax=Melastoma candidum TaxID=119954 RepID=A0ACB9N3J1_9MYRT|nr:hypothetical protein MLD38_028534 [Melastoma candidum]